MAENPDELVLKKEDILNFCDRVLKRWTKDPNMNPQNIIAMNAVRTSVAWTDEETLKAVWGEITGWLYELMYENAMARASREGAKWPDAMKGARS